MIIWLASYPKSGNTLLRSILATYFFSDNGEFKFEHLYKIDQFPSIHHFKNIGLDVSNENIVFQNFINAQKFIKKWGQLPDHDDQTFVMPIRGTNVKTRL